MFFIIRKIKVAPQLSYYTIVPFDSLWKTIGIDKSGYFFGKGVVFTRSEINAVNLYGWRFIGKCPEL